MRDRGYVYAPFVPIHVLNATSTQPRRSLLRQALALCIVDGVTSSPLCYLWLPGNFIVAALLTEYYHLSEASYGLIVSLIFLVIVLSGVVLGALASILAIRRYLRV